MLKKLAALCITIAGTALLTVPAFAITEGDWEFDIMNNEVTINKYNGSEKNVTIPSTIYGGTVTKLAKHDIFSYDSKKTVTSLTVPGTIKTIEYDNFSSLTNLETVTLSEGIEEIDSWSFSSCEKLKQVRLPNTLTSIGYEAFKRCHSLSEINFPSNLKEVKGEAFWECGFESIDLSAMSEPFEWGIYVFANCENLKNVKLYESMTTIPSGMFDHCTSLKEVPLPANLTTIKNSAFWGCKSLEDIVLPTSLKEIEFEVFCYCDSLKEVIVPAETEEIGSYTFNHCPKLEAVYLPDSIVKLDASPIKDSPNAIIYCSDGSYAAQYCQSKGISYLTDSSVNSGITVKYNGKRISFAKYEQNPEVVDGRTLVPLRAIFEAMNANVDWDQATMTATARKGSDEIKIQIGANLMYKNGQEISVDVPAQIINSRTMIPARVISEAFGAEVGWNGNGKVVSINMK